MASSSGREQQLLQTFVELADTLVVGYDIVDLLHTLVERCALILDATDAGILLPDPTGTLQVVASTSERSQLISLLQLQADEGPCVDAYQTGRLVTVDDIAAAYARWPHFAAEASGVGYRSMHAIPLRLRNDTIGSLNLFRDQAGPLSPDDAAAAQALADVATIGILQERALRHADIAREQLQHALDSRVLIEQAKGVLAQLEGIGFAEAFEQMRSRARNSGTRLSVVAEQVIRDAQRR
ncbi:GAF and ANTAR domain-containing protein [Leifsonia sp. NPDC056824]|uniref:GAF and ANTAR domain-containing protein n=1 Tax=Leifsonia sp. NPDC056824 TaxID=3345953 RepID=UPI0036B00F31